MASMTATGREADEGYLDPQLLVERCLGNLDLVQRLLTRYMDSGSHDCQQLEAALQVGDLATIATIAHRLKGSSATIGSQRMTDLAALIETASRTNDVAELESLATEIGETQSEVRKHCQKSIAIYQALLANGGGE